jgi:hypothetical protein
VSAADEALEGHSVHEGEGQLEGVGRGKGIVRGSDGRGREDLGIYGQRLIPEPSVQGDHDGGQLRVGPGRHPQFGPGRKGRPLEHRPQDVDRRAELVGPGREIGEGFAKFSETALEQPVDSGRQQPGLGGEVVQLSTPGYARSAGYLRCGGGGIPEFDQALESGIQEGGARLDGPLLERAVAGHLSFVPVQKQSVKTVSL